MCPGIFFSLTFRSVKQQPNKRIHSICTARCASLFGAALLFVLSSSCSNEESVVSQVNAPLKEYPLNEQFGARITYSDSGLQVLEIQSGIVQDFGHLDPSYVFFGDGLRVKFYNGEELSSTVLTADTARQLKKDDLWAIGGNVSVTNGKGERMQTELLYWDKAAERLYSDASVQIITDGQLIMGQGFEADQEFNTYRLFKVKGEITIDDE
jgi:LPS export ABC transporter protein LptC